MSVCGQGDPAEVTVKECQQLAKETRARTRRMFTLASLVMSGYLSTQRTGKTPYKRKQCEFRNGQEI